MTGQEALNLLMSRLGSRTDAALRATLLLEINAMQRELEAMPMLPWFLKGDDTSVSTTPGQEYAQLPTTFLRVDDDWGGVYWQNVADSSPDNWLELTRTPYPTMKARYREDTSANSPERFDILADRIYIRPIPDGVYPLRFVGYFSDTVIAVS